MFLKNLKNNPFFSITQTPQGRILIKILGIKIRFLKKETREEREKITNYYTQYKSITEIPPAEGDLRLIQLASVKFFKKLDKIFEKHQINYWIDYGTLLGAVRHKGFIPWDDDIDVGMMRTDYNKLISLFENGTINEPDIELIFDSNSRDKCFVKLKMNKVENLNIDIFPHDFYYTKLSESEKLDLARKIIKTCKRNLWFIRSDKNLRKQFKKITETKILENKQVNIEEKPDIFRGVDFPHYVFKRVYSFNEIFPLKRIKFEDGEFYAPNCPETITGIIYGNYMEFPKDCYPRHSSYLTLTDKEREEYIQYVK